MKKVFYSGRNIFLNIIFNVFILGVLFIIVLLLVEQKGYFLIPFLVLGIALVVWIWYSPLKYIVENESFYFISGWKKSKKIPISSFTTIKKSHTPIAGPARGIRRIKIETTGGHLIIISPRGRDEFIRLIKEINPKMKTLDLRGNPIS